MFGECGRLPLRILIKSCMISYWNRIITGYKNKLSYKIHKFMLDIPNIENQMDLKNKKYIE